MAKKVAPDRGNAQGLGSVNKVVPLGQNKPSNNAWLGVDGRVEDGTNGSRPNSSHAKYGGELDASGPMFRGPSVAPNANDKQMNSGNAQKDSAGSGQYGPGSFTVGGYGSRENMTIGNDGNRGKLVGAGANATPLSSFDRFFNNLPSEPGLDLEHGTSDSSKNEQAATRGLGKRNTKLPSAKD